MKAVIMAGGLGTRIQSISGGLPKSMIRVGGRSILQYQIENLTSFGVTDIVIVTGPGGGLIEEFFGDGSSFGVHITYFREEEPLGTAGALYLLSDFLTEDFLVIMGDLMMSVDFGRFAAAHALGGGLVTLFVHPNSHPFDSDIVVTETDMKPENWTEDRCGIRIPYPPQPDRSTEKVTGFIGKHENRKYYHNLVSSGLYMLSPKALVKAPRPAGGRASIDHDIVGPLVSLSAVRAYRSSEYVKDMGTPERFREVERDLANGLPEARNLRHRQKAVFIDRDGTLNRFNGFICNPSGLSLLPGAAEGLGRLNGSDYLAVLITNQPGAARGLVGFEEQDEVNAAFETLLAGEGVYLDRLYYCLHHPDVGFDGERRELKFRCRCRKPEPGMILEAARDLRIDLAKSWMVGDAGRDILCGRNAGVGTIGVLSGEAERAEDFAGTAVGDAAAAVEALGALPDGSARFMPEAMKSAAWVMAVPDYVFGGFSDAVGFILSGQV